MEQELVQTLQTIGIELTEINQSLSSLPDIKDKIQFLLTSIPSELKSVLYPTTKNIEDASKNLKNAVKEVNTLKKEIVEETKQNKKQEKKNKSQKKIATITSNLNKMMNKLDTTSSKRTDFFDEGKKVYISGISDDAAKKLAKYGSLKEKAKGDVVGWLKGEKQENLFKKMFSKDGGPIKTFLGAWLKRLLVIAGGLGVTAVWGNREQIFDMLSEANIIGPKGKRFTKEDKSMVGSLISNISEAVKKGWDETVKWWYAEDGPKDDIIKMSGMAGNWIYDGIRKAMVKRYYESTDDGEILGIKWDNVWKDMKTSMLIAFAVAPGPMAGAAILTAGKVTKMVTSLGTMIAAKNVSGPGATKLLTDVSKINSPMALTLTSMMGSLILMSTIAGAWTMFKGGQELGEMKDAVEGRKKQRKNLKQWEDEKLSTGQFVSNIDLAKNLGFVDQDKLQNIIDNVGKIGIESSNKLIQELLRGDNGERSIQDLAKMQAELESKGKLKTRDEIQKHVLNIIGPQPEKVKTPTGSPIMQQSERRYWDELGISEQDWKSMSAQDKVALINRIKSQRTKENIKKGFMIPGKWLGSKINDMVKDEDEKRQSSIDYSKVKSAVGDAMVTPIGKNQRPSSIQNTMFDKKDEFFKNSDGTLVAAKKGGVLDKSIDNVDLHVQELKPVMEKIENGIDNLVGLTSQTLQAASQPQTTGQPFGPVTSGDGREPSSDKAYAFRARVHELLFA